MVNFNHADVDGVDEFMEQQIRIAMSVLGQAGQVAMRAHEHTERAREQSERAVAEQNRERLEAERSAAHVLLSRTRDEQWWQNADGEQIAKAYGTAHAWAAAGDPVARTYQESMETEIERRYGISPETMRQMMIEAEQERDRDHSDGDRAERAASKDRTEGAALPVANAADGTEEAARDAAYDSAERREAFAEQMRAEGVEDQAVADRLRSDMSQGRPAADAVQPKSAERRQQQKPRNTRQPRREADRSR